jgi:hypothetical protein
LIYPRLPLVLTTCSSFSTSFPNGRSERQARLDAEKDNMMEKLNKKLKTEEFDNTKRIERPEEILERRKKEREDRNKWYKRTWRWITWQQ